MAVARSVAHTPPIPEPRNDVDSLFASVMALKAAVEDIVGTRGHDANVRSCVYTQKTPPKITHNGDFWLTEGVSSTLSVSYNGKWYKIADLQP